MLTPWVKFYIISRRGPRNITLICRSDLQRPAFHNHNFVGDWLALEDFRDVLQYLPATAGSYLELGQDDFLPHPHKSWLTSFRIVRDYAM